MSKYEPVLEYDYEDTPKCWLNREAEKKYIKEEIERRIRNAD